MSIPMVGRGWVDVGLDTAEAVSNSAWESVYVAYVPIRALLMPEGIVIEDADRSVYAECQPALEEAIAALEPFAQQDRADKSRLSRKVSRTP